MKKKATILEARLRRRIRELRAEVARQEGLLVEALNYAATLNREDPKNMMKRRLRSLLENRADWRPMHEGKPKKASGTRDYDSLSDAERRDIGLSASTCRMTRRWYSAWRSKKLGFWTFRILDPDDKNFEAQDFDMTLVPHYDLRGIWDNERYILLPCRGGRGR